MPIPEKAHKDAESQTPDEKQKTIRTLDIQTQTDPP